MNKIRKVLIIRFSSIGDIVLTTPLLRALKNEMPNVSVHFLVKQRFAQVIEHNPNIDKIHQYNGSFRETINLLQSENFDYVVDLQNNLRSNRIKRRLGKKYSTVNKLNIRKWIYVTFKINRMPDRHIVDRYFDTLKPLKISNNRKGLEFFAEPQADQILDTLGSIITKGNYIAAAVGAAHYTKQIPTEQYIEIINKTGKPIVFIGGNSDSEKAEHIIQNIKVKAINTCGICTLGQTSEIIKNSRVVITPDTGAMHIAAAHYKPIVSLWGNTVPEFGMYPYMPQNNNLYYLAEVHDLKCRPCSKIGFKRCPKKHFKCMKNQNIDAIVDKIEYFWQSEHIHSAQ